MTSSQSDWLDAVGAICDSQNVVVFTGAGVSAESDIATFRDDGGFWTRFPPEEFAHWSGLLKTAATDPRRLAEFLLAVLEPIAEAQPNAGHQAIAELEEHVRLTVVTQNIDGLHQAAGSTVVKEIHGTLLETVDLRTGRFRRLITQHELRQVAGSLRAAMSSSLPRARLLKAIQPLLGIDVRGGHRPNLVLFGDAMAEPAWSESLAAVSECDTLLVVGTSGEVFPAATLPLDALSRGATVITVDPGDSGVGIHIRGTAADVLPRLVRDAFPECPE